MANRDLPPMPALRVFDAAVRHSSFSAAADELGMTQASVSYQIKVLEDRVGDLLFERHARGVVLTPIGKEFAEQVLPAMGAISEAFRAIKGTTQHSLKINAIPTFATNFLSGLIYEFQEQNPNIKVQLEISENTVDVASTDCDLAIRLGDGQFDGFECRLLFPSMFTPMLSPDLVKEESDVSHPEDLLKLPILSPGDPRWQIWMRSAKVNTERFVPDASQHFGTQTIEAKAAVAGHGIAMLTPAFFQKELDMKLLIQPFDLLAEDGNSYWLISGKNLATTPKVRSFRTWLAKKTEVFRRSKSESSERT